MIVMLVNDADGSILVMRETDNPNLPLGDFVALDGKEIKYSKRILNNTKGKTRDYMIEHMRVSQDNGDGTVEVEDAGT